MLSKGVSPHFFFLTFKKSLWVSLHRGGLHSHFCFSTQSTCDVLYLIRLKKQSSISVHALESEEYFKIQIIVNILWYYDITQKVFISKRLTAIWKSEISLHYQWSFIFCYTKIFWFKLYFEWLSYPCMILWHLEHTDSLRYRDLPKADTLLYITSKNHIH